MMICDASLLNHRPSPPSTVLEGRRLKLKADHVVVVVTVVVAGVVVVVVVVAVVVMGGGPW
jgi:hypothetical protein